MKNEAKKKYASKCKQKIVTFYKCDANLLAFASKINFQAFVKDALRNALLNSNGKENKHGKRNIL